MKSLIVGALALFATASMTMAQAPAPNTINLCTGDSGGV